MAGFIDALAELEARKAELDSQIKAASPKEAEGVDGEAAEAARAIEQPRRGVQ